MVLRKMWNIPYTYTMALDGPARPFVDAYMRQNVPKIWPKAAPNPHNIAKSVYPSFT